jgi:hypothetical protein
MNNHLRLLHIAQAYDRYMNTNTGSDEARAIEALITQLVCLYLEHDYSTLDELVARVRSAIMEK